MYNMYSWDQAARPADEHAGTQPTETQSATRNGHPASYHGSPASPNGSRATPNGQAGPRQASAAARHAQAVQFSLDRRDNGGDAGRTR